MKLKLFLVSKLNIDDTSDRIDINISPFLFVRYISQQAKILELIFLFNLHFVKAKLKQIEVGKPTVDLLKKFCYPLIPSQFMVVKTFYKTSNN